MAQSDHEGPGVRLPPPLIFVAGFVVGLLADGVVPLRLLGPEGRGLAVTGGWTAVALGLGLTFWGMGTFVRRRTAVMPHLPARRLVTDGPYRFTRNPMYLGLALSYTGIALLVDTAWPLVVLPVVLVIIVRYVIRREERHLERTFGDEYRTYRERVGRWL
jgi:protein-S-isoprenylcysteine O-methyltransferase Ste14